jgi:hypothetical protein
MSKKSIVTSLIIIALLIITCVPVFGFQFVVPLSADQSWAVGISKSHNTAYSYCAAKLYAVYPQNGGTDNLRYVDCRIVDSDENYMVGYPYYTLLDERSTGVTPIHIVEGEQDQTLIDFFFRVHYSGTAAYASVDCWGTYNINNGSYY